MTTIKRGDQYIANAEAENEEDHIEYSADSVKTASLEALREIVKTNSYATFTWGGGVNDHMIIDLTTARAMMTVYEAIKPDNRAKFERMIAASPAQFAKVANFCWDHISLGGN